MQSYQDVLNWLINFLIPRTSISNRHLLGSTLLSRKTPSIRYNFLTAGLYGDSFDLSIL